MGTALPFMHSLLHDTIKHGAQQADMARKACTQHYFLLVNVHAQVTTTPSENTPKRPNRLLSKTETGLVCLHR